MILPVLLCDEIYQRLLVEARGRGVEIVDLARWILGDWVNDTRVPEGIAAGPTNDQMIMWARMLAAVQGILACEECTQKLKVGDVAGGQCPHCGASLGHVVTDGG